MRFLALLKGRPLVDQIRDFQALTTAQFDVLPPILAKNLDAIISGLENGYDAARVIRLMSAFQHHIYESGLLDRAHPNFIFDRPELATALLEQLLIDYNLHADAPETQETFDAVFADRPDLILELVRRLRLNEDEVLEETGATAVSPYETQQILAMEEATPVVGYTIRDTSAERILGIASSDSISHYKPLLASAHPIPQAGTLMIELGNFGDVPADDRLLVMLEGENFTFRIWQVADEPNVIRCGLRIGSEAEDLNEATLASDASKRRFVLAYSNTIIWQAWLNGDNEVESYDFIDYPWISLRPTKLTVYTELIAQGHPTVIAELTSVSLFGRLTIHSADGEYLLVNPA